MGNVMRRRWQRVSYWNVVSLPTTNVAYVCVYPILWPSAWKPHILQNCCLLGNNREATGWPQPSPHGSFHAGTDGSATRQSLHWLSLPPAIKRRPKVSLVCLLVLLTILHVWICADMFVYWLPWQHPCPSPVAHCVLEVSLSFHWVHSFLVQLPSAHKGSRGACPARDVMSMQTPTLFK